MSETEITPLAPAGETPPETQATPPVAAADAAPDAAAAAAAPVEASSAEPAPVEVTVAADSPEAGAADAPGTVPATGPGRGTPVPSPADTAQQLKQSFPALFAGAVKPIKLRIQVDIQQRAPGKFSKQALSTFFRRHTGSTSYLLAVTKAPHRFDLDGQPAGEITAEHRQVAQDELARRRENQQSRRELEEQQRRNRAGLLHDYQTTTPYQGELLRAQRRARGRPRRIAGDCAQRSRGAGPTDAGKASQPASGSRTGAESERRPRAGWRRFAPGSAARDPRKRTRARGPWSSRARGFA